MAAREQNGVQKLICIAIDCTVEALARLTGGQPLVLRAGRNLTLSHCRTVELYPDVQRILVFVKFCKSLSSLRS